jgi:hypothetical protein
MTDNLPNPDQNRGTWKREVEIDLSKPIDHLVVDVHEETHNLNDYWKAYTEKQLLGNIAGAQKRFASLIARVAISNERLAKRTEYLNWVIIGLTIILIALTGVLVRLTIVLVRFESLTK